jgi:hypothetical protein
MRELISFELNIKSKILSLYMNVGVLLFCITRSCVFINCSRSFPFESVDLQYHSSCLALKSPSIIVFLLFFTILVSIVQCLFSHLVAHSMILLLFLYYLFVFLLLLFLILGHFRFVCFRVVWI